MLKHIAPCPRLYQYPPFSVPVSWASMRKDLDWDVPDLGCQSSVSSIRRFLLASLRARPWVTSGWASALLHSQTRDNEKETPRGCAIAGSLCGEHILLGRHAKMVQQDKVCLFFIYTSMTQKAASESVSQIKTHANGK